MGLARVFPNLGSLIIRKLSDVGGPPRQRIEAELDNIIAWAKDAKRCIRRDFSTVNSSGAGPDVLHTFTLDTPNRLLTDGDYLDVWYAGKTASNDNDKAVQARFGGVTYETMAAFDLDGTVGWAIAARIMRLTSTSVRVSHMMNFNVIAGDSAAPPAMNTFGSGGFILSRNNDITGLSNLGSNSITMDVRSLGVAAADVVQNMSIIELCQQ